MRFLGQIRGILIRSHAFRLCAGLGHSVKGLFPGAEIVRFARLPRRQQTEQQQALLDDNKGTGNSNNAGVGRDRVVVEKRISPLRCSQRREQLRSK
jgi:hypothetical protein